MSATESKEEKLEVIEAKKDNFFAMESSAYALKKKIEELKKLFEERKAESEQKRSAGEIDKSILLYEEATLAFNSYLHYAHKYYHQLGQMQSVKPKIEIPRNLRSVDFPWGLAQWDSELLIAANMKHTTGNLFYAQGNLQKASDWHSQAVNYYIHILKEDCPKEKREGIFEKIREIIALHENAFLEQRKWMNNILFKRKVSDLYLVRASLTTFSLAMFFLILGLSLMAVLSLAAFQAIVIVLVPTLITLSGAIFLSARALDHQLSKEIKQGKKVIILSQEQAKSLTNKSTLAVTPSSSLEQKKEFTPVVKSASGSQEKQNTEANPDNSTTNSSNLT